MNLHKLIELRDSFAPLMLATRIIFNTKIRRFVVEYIERSKERKHPANPTVKPKKYRKENYAVLWACSGNLGDDIQTLAARILFKRHGITDLTFIDREHCENYDGPPIKLLMNGWFAHNSIDFSKFTNIAPLFIGFHSTRWFYENTVKHQADFFKKYEPIGCRDMATVKMLQDCGIGAYFTGCPTLCFDEVSEKGDKSFIVDPTVHAPKRLLDEFREFELVEHEISRNTNRTSYVWYLPWRLKIAQKLLDDYSRAKLVVTSRLHCALPCRALNTDVVFFHHNYQNDPRFTGLETILSGQDLSNDKLDLSHRTVDRSLVTKQRQFIFEKFDEQIGRLRSA